MSIGHQVNFGSGGSSAAYWVDQESVSAQYLVHDLHQALSWQFSLLAILLKTLKLYYWREYRLKGVRSHPNQLPRVILYPIMSLDMGAAVAPISKRFRT